MLKTALVVAAVTGLFAAVAIQTTPADASRADCRQMANARYPAEGKMRRDFKRYCLREWKAYKAANRGAPR
jgi:hypothetical protein